MEDDSTQVETNIFDEEEIHTNCTVQILRNSITGEVSVGWWKNEGETMDKLYVLYKKNKNGAHIPIGYAYGDEWVEQALLMDDVRYDTPEEAKAAWERWKEKNAEYISKEVAIENAIDQMRHSNSEKAMRERILNLEAADVRPVVLCRDCEYYQADCGWCGLFDIGMNVKDFCSRGKKREES